MSNCPDAFGVSFFVLALIFISPSWAQQTEPPAIGSSAFAPRVASETDSELRISARYYLIPNKREGFVIVRFQIPANHHIYGVHQPKDAPQTRLELSSVEGVRLTGAFRPDKKPKVKKDDPVFGMTIVEHSGDVQFYAPIAIPEGFDARRDAMQVRVNGQMCSDEGYCLPIMERKVPIPFAGYYQRQAEQTFEQHKK